MTMTVRIDLVGPFEPEALELEARMQSEYVEMYGEPDQDPDNHISGAEEVLLLRDEDRRPIGLTAWSRWADGDGKIRLMYVVPELRALGLAGRLLLAAEHRMKGEGVRHVRFETGPQQQPAMRLYERMGYTRLAEGFGFYADNEGSVFYGKWL